MEAAFRPCVIRPVSAPAATGAAGVRGAAGFVDRVLVVDDGSGDGSGEASRAGIPPGREGNPLEVLRLDPNRGKGAAILAGLGRAAALGCTHAVVLDADGQHFPSDIPRFLEEARSRPRAIILGERRLEGTRAPRASGVGRWVSNFWTLRTTGFDLADTQCGFRAYPVEEVLALPLRRRRYDFEVEVLVRGAWAGLDLVSIPVKVWYPPREERISHFRALADNVRISWTYTLLVARRLLPTRVRWKEAKGRPRPGIRLRETLRVLKELGRGGTRPAEIGLAVATGAFIGSTPLWGLHGILSVYVCGRLHLNVLAAFLGSNVSLPFLAPYLIFASVQCGHLMLRGTFLPLDGGLIDPSRMPENVLLYILGSLPVATVLAVVLGSLSAAVAWLIGRKRGRR